MWKWFAPALLAITPAAAPAQTPAAAPSILAFGDSLTAGYGLDPGLGFAPQLQAALRRQGIRVSVHDAGVSGDTSEAGRARLGWTLSGLQRPPDLVIVELGANDMLRGIDPKRTEANLDAILTELEKRRIPVLLAGMLAAPNLDPAYRRQFDGLYPRLAAEHRATLYPFFLAGVAGNRSLAIADGMHPNFEGIKRIVGGILPTVSKALAAPRPR